MIRLDRGGLIPTPPLAKAQSDLAAATATKSGRAVVTSTDHSAWLSVRPQLVAAQNKKCGYCEDYLRERMVEIDHVRPKKSSEYWWLAFSIENLVATCRSCNNAKSDRWELQPGTAKLAPRQTPWTVAETAMLVDPTSEDPDPHIGFIYAGQMWRIAALTDRGRWTIENLELDRDSFTYESNELIIDVIDPLAREVDAAKEALDRDRLTSGVDALKRLDKPRRRWSQMTRALTAHVVRGTYRTPVLP